MYGIIQFAACEGGTTAVVLNKWLTPRKTEVYWPPVKDSKKFEKILEQRASPDAKWKIYNIERVFYETDDLDKAKRKLKISEITSDLQTEAEDEPKRVSKRTRRYVSTDDEEVTDGLVRPPPLKKHISKYVDAECEITPDDDPVGDTHIQEIANPSDFSILKGITDLNQLSSSPNVHEYTGIQYKVGSNAHIVQEIANPSYFTLNDITNPYQSTSTRKVDKYTGYQDKVISLLSLIKNQNEQILVMLKGKLETSELDPDFEFPIRNEDGIRATEDILKNKEKYANLVNCIKSIGGRDLSNKVTRAMKFVLLDSVAAHYSFYGKRSNKKAFSELYLEKCLVDAVSCSTPGITKSKVEDQIKVWLKHAPDRNKLRNVKDL